ncbi:MAG: hypothetical protein D3903_06400 [Candidatus Electrothrix sp. GM3_4]|nr:hypothetical protein [Candidatus Electrothrix sp. GM3_4]
MSSDEDIARRSIEMQNRAKDYSLCELPGYWEWCKKKQTQGIPQDIIMHLDSMCMWLLPEDAQKINESAYEEFLEDLLEELGETQYIKKDN